MRLLQTAYHNPSLALYASLWFQIRAAISTMLSKPIREDILGRIVRAAVEFDVENATLYVKLYPVMIEMVKLETVRSKELRK